MPVSLDKTRAILVFLILNALEAEDLACSKKESEDLASSSTSNVIEIGFQCDFNPCNYSVFWF